MEATAKIMTLALDLPECKPSLLRRLDACWKLAGLLIATSMLALVETLAPALAALAVSVLLVIVARLPWRWYLRRMGTAVLMFVLFLIWLPLALEDGRLTMSLPGLERLIVLSAKLGGMVSLMLVLLVTSPLQDTFKAAHALRIPSLLIQLM